MHLNLNLNLFRGNIYVMCGVFGKVLVFLPLCCPQKTTLAWRNVPPKTCFSFTKNRELGHHERPSRGPRFPRVTVSCQKQVTSDRVVLNRFTDRRFLLLASDSSRRPWAVTICTSFSGVQCLEPVRFPGGVNLRLFRRDAIW